MKGSAMSQYITVFDDKESVIYLNNQPWANMTQIKQFLPLHEICSIEKYTDKDGKEYIRYIVKAQRAKGQITGQTNRHRIDARRRKTLNLTSVNSLVNHSLRHTMTALGSAAVELETPKFFKKICFL